MKKYIFLGLVMLSAQAQAQDTSALDLMVEETKALLPPEYLTELEARKAAPSEGLLEAFPKALDRADCKLGLRFGKTLATSVLTRLKPSCDKLLAPIGTEWIPPAQAERSEAFGRCFDTAFSRQASQIVYDTAELCAWSGFEGSLEAGQAAYNTCYLEVAEQVGEATFVQDPYTPGSFALIPSNSERWEVMLANIRSNYGSQSGYIAMLCELGKADAENGVLPGNILKHSTN